MGGVERTLEHFKYKFEIYHLFFPLSVNKRSSDDIHATTIELKLKLKVSGMVMNRARANHNYNININNSRIHIVKALDHSEVRCTTSVSNNIFEGFVGLRLASVS